MAHWLFRLRTSLARLWGDSAPLTAIGLAMLPLLAASLLGLWLDPRSIAGAPAWLKPAKFAASIAVYSLTLAWAFRYLPRHPRVRRWVGGISAGVFAIEFAIIALQAWRGQRSHFNTSSLLDGALFTIMGASIVLQTLSSVAVAVALFRERFADRALGWALRLGLCITILGASIGGLMTRPTPAQLEGMRTAPPAVIGAHTVGAPDGGPGLPGTGWSRDHGDLRVPHFFGLHALQVLPLVAIGLRRSRRPERQRVRLLLSSAASYAGLVGLLLWQALRGRPLLDAGTVTALLVWAVASLLGPYLIETLNHRGASRGGAFQKLPAR
ncbi:MAG TPA: hypothetical protein VFS67_25945 [Polyangiaceae bacterium]|jgi:hypothetical protein|nr:hypothetical protein [Polyangiaceae bacterium]